MEALLFMLDSLVIVILVLQGLKDDRRAPGAPAVAIFRIRDDAAKRPEKRAEPLVQNSFLGGEGL